MLRQSKETAAIGIVRRLMGWPIVRMLAMFAVWPVLALLAQVTGDPLVAIVVTGLALVTAMSLAAPHSRIGARL